MSTEPFADQSQGANPYASPAASGHETSATNPLLVPAIILLVLWTPWALYLLFLVVLFIILPEPFRSSSFADQQVMLVTSYSLMSVVNVLSIAGAVAMLRSGPKWLAWTGAILGVVPLFGPCFGLTLPIAIWTIVLLRRPDVNARF